MSLERIYRTIGKYIKYPNTLLMDIKKQISKGRYKKLGLEGFEPNYIFFNRFSPKSTLIDVGCGFEAELSVTFIQKFGLKAFAVDPTQKHQPFLKQIEAKYPQNFKHLPYALAAKCGNTVFYESEHCESGSLLDSHQNVKSDNVSAYDVELINLPALFEKINASKIDFLKIDIEGAEYSLFNAENLKALEKVDQLFLEFHHVSVENYTKKDSLEIVSKIQAVGFESFSNDGLNYLFYKKA